MNDYESRRVMLAEVLETDLTARIRMITTCLDNGSLDGARQYTRELIEPRRPQEYQMEGHHLLGVIESRAGNLDKAAEHLEHSRKIAVELEDYAQAARTQEVLRLITEDPEEAQRYRDLWMYYEAEAVKRGNPERFRTFDPDVE